MFYAEILFCIDALKMNTKMLSSNCQVVLQNTYPGMITQTIAIKNGLIVGTLNPSMGYYFIKKWTFLLYLFIN